MTDHLNPEGDCECRLCRARRDLHVQAVEALLLYEELMSLEVLERWEAIRDARFLNLFVANLLADESWRIALEHPKLSEELAGLAHYIAGQSHPEALASWRDEIAVRSCCLLGNARRLQGDPEGAEQRFRAALPFLMRRAPHPPA